VLAAVAVGGDDSANDVAWFTGEAWTNAWTNTTHVRSDETDRRAAGDAESETGRGRGGRREGKRGGEAGENSEKATRVTADECGRREIRTLSMTYGKLRLRVRDVRARTYHDDHDVHNDDDNRRRRQCDTSGRAPPFRTTTFAVSAQLNKRAAKHSPPQPRRVMRG